MLLVHWPLITNRASSVQHLEHAAEVAHVVAVVRLCWRRQQLGADVVVQLDCGRHHARQLGRHRLSQARAPRPPVQAARCRAVRAGRVLHAHRAVAAWSPGSDSSTAPAWRDQWPIQVAPMQGGAKARPIAARTSR